jgi:hypothetical protein
MLPKVIPLVNPLNVLCVEPPTVTRRAALMASMEYLATDFTLLVEINMLVPNISFPGDSTISSSKLHTPALFTTDFNFSLPLWDHISHY